LRLIQSFHELLARLARDIRQIARDSGRWQHIQLAESLPDFGEKSTPPSSPVSPTTGNTARQTHHRQQIASLLRM
jgi:hypothetical protein